MKAVIFVCLLASALFNCALADVAKTGRELTKVQSEIRKISDNLKRIEKNKQSLSAQLATLEKRYGNIAVSLTKLHKQINQTQKKLKSLHKAILHAKAQTEQQNKVLGSQIKAAYAMGQKERLKLVFNQQDPALSSRMLVYYDYLNKARIKKIDEIERMLVHLEQLEVQKREEALSLENNLAKKKREQIELTETKNARAEVLARLDKDFSTGQYHLQQLKQSEKRLKEIIISLQASMDDFPFEAGAAKPFPHLKGQLPWPLKGKLLKKFGSRRSESKWDGVLIGAKEGTKIHAVTRGRVVFSDWLRGYGLLVIIDHGKGYMTLYAFNQSLYTEVGDWVDAGDVIATVGNSGGRSQVGLYFGIRKKGKPVDPVRWCRKVLGSTVG